MLPENFPYVPDFDKIKYWDAEHAKKRESGCRRWRKWYHAHVMDRLKRVPTGPGNENRGTWAIRALLDKTGVIIFIACCREYTSIVGLVDGIQGKEVDLFSGVYERCVARDLIKSLVAFFKPVGNKGNRKGHWVGGQGKDSSAFWSCF